MESVSNSGGSGGDSKLGSEIERKNRVSSSASIERELGVQPVTTEAYVMTGIAAKYVIEISSIHHHVKLHAPTIGAAAYLRMAGRPPILPSNLSYSENVLYRLDSLGDRSYKPNPKLARVLEIPIILHAEHEMNCSTAPARHLASSDVDVYAALAGAVGALYGPLHGGANEAVLKMLSEIESVDNIPEFIEGVQNRKRKMSGFGHRVYKKYDPRAKIIKKLAEEVVIALEKAALSDEYFVKGNYILMSTSIPG